MAEKQLKITLIRSTIGCLKNQKETVESLGLKKINQFKIHTDSATLQGKIAKVAHLVKVEEYRG